MSATPRNCARSRRSTASTRSSFAKRSGGSEARPTILPGRGAFTPKAIEATAKLFGDTSALKALKEGEEHGLKDYREALEDVDGSTRRLIAEVLIPAQQRHITTLDAMMTKIDR